MERVVEVGISAKRKLPTMLFGARSRRPQYGQNRLWIRCGLVGLGCAIACISGLGLWDILLRHAVWVLLPLPMVLVAWLVIAAERARQMFRPSQTCRRQ